TTPSESTTAARSWSLPLLLGAAALFAVLATAALLVDLPLARFVREHHLPGELARLIHLSEFFAWGGTVALLIVTAAMLDPRRWRVALRLAIPAYAAGVLADGIKLLVARQRPSSANLQASVLETFVAWLPIMRGDALGQPYGYALKSFPSAHAATATGL